MARLHLFEQSGLAGLVSVSVLPCDRDVPRIRIPQNEKAALKWFSIAVLALFGYVIYVSFEIGRQSTIDEPARPTSSWSSALRSIAGTPFARSQRPASIMRSDLYNRKMAPILITTGGAAANPDYTEERGRTRLPHRIMTCRRRPSS